MNKLMATTAAIMLAAGLAAAPARAAVITQNFNFTSHDFHALFGSTATPPVDPLIGSVTITFDDAQSATDKTTGIVLNSLNIALGSPIGFTYLAGTHGMVIGGSAGGVSLVNVGADDFWIQIQDANTTPVFTVAAYAQTGYPSTAFLTPLSETTQPSTTTGVPEPQTWALFILGFGGAGALLRRRASSIVRRLA